MKLVRWKRFTWDLSKLPPLESALPAHYHLRIATREDLKAIQEVIFSAFSLDMSWGDTFKTFKDQLMAQVEEAFESSVPAVVISHGQRIIAASALNWEVDADSHLASGPCVRIEYRNRGIGTVLLHESLKQLKGGGLTTAHGITKETAPTKFVYAKFGAKSAVYEFEPSTVES